MFTIEMDWDETAITILDPDGEYEDLQVIAYDDIVYMRQWDEDIQRFILMSFSPKMFLSLMQSFKLPEGAYMLKTEEDL
jgi:hypothetical protein